MRKFSVVLSVPTACDCCGAALPAHDAGLSRGEYRLELPEGDYPTTCQIGEGVRVTLALGRILVELRQPRAARRGWDVMPHYNPGAFARLQRSWTEETDAAGEKWGWQSFSFSLPEFKPTFSTWWAELRFVEVIPFASHSTGSPVEAHSPAKLSIKLETLE